MLRSRCHGPELGNGTCLVCGLYPRSPGFDIYAPALFAAPRYSLQTHNTASFPLVRGARVGHRDLSVSTNSKDLGTEIELAERNQHLP